MTVLTTPALTSKTTTHEMVGYQKWGDQNRAGVRAVLDARFTHRNADGTIYVPRIASSVVYAPWYHVITLEPQALWHFSEKDLLHEDVLNAIAGTVHRPTRYISEVPGESGKPSQKGIAYVITLHDLPTPAATPLPDVAPFDLRNRPTGDLLIPFGVGAGGPVWKPLPLLGHSMITGTQGSGKSMFLHCVIAALAQEPIDKIRLALIDPKQNEFAMWGDLAHLIAPIALSEGDATTLLDDLAARVDERGSLMASVYCRNIEGYNKQAATPLPYILCIVDECLDLVSLAGARSDLAQRLKTIAVRGRSAGVYLWAATQHASAVEGMPRVVNVNLTTRFAFRVLDADAARAAKCPGADKIAKSKPGRMLVKLDEIEAYQAPNLDDEALLAIARPGRSGRPVTQKSELSTDDRELAEWAINENGGYLSVKNVQVRTGSSKREAETLAARWERKGWLVKDKTAGNKRRITDKLVQLLGGVENV